MWFLSVGHSGADRFEHVSGQASTNATVEICGALYNRADVCVKVSDCGRNPRAPTPRPQVWKLTHEWVRIRAGLFAADLLFIFFSDRPGLHCLRGRVDPNRLRRG